MLDLRTADDLLLKKLEELLEPINRDELGVAQVLLLSHTNQYRDDLA